MDKEKNKLPQEITAAITELLAKDKSLLNNSRNFIEALEARVPDEFVFK